MVLKHSQRMNSLELRNHRGERNASRSDRLCGFPLTYCTLLYMDYMFIPVTSVQMRHSLWIEDSTTCNWVLLIKAQVCSSLSNLIIHLVSNVCPSTYCIAPILFLLGLRFYQIYHYRV